jgi:hypothetical protein
MALEGVRIVDLKEISSYEEVTSDQEFGLFTDNEDFRISTTTVAEFVHQKFSKPYTDEETARATEAEREGLAEAKRYTDNEADRATQAEQGLQTAVQEEALTARNAEQQLGSSLSAEQLRAEGIETALRTDVNKATDDIAILTDEVESARGNYPALNSRLNSIIGNLASTTNGLTAEVNRATQAETALQADLNAEADRATQAEIVLQADLNAEADRATQAEIVLQTDLNAEADRATHTETALQTDLNAEADRATHTETALQNDLNSVTAEVIEARGVNIDVNTRFVSNEASISELARLTAALRGTGGYVKAFNFGSETPSQDAITTYVLSQIPGITADEIFNGTRVENLYNYHVWVLANTPDTNPPVFEWMDGLIDTVGIMSSTTLGLGKSSTNVQGVSANPTTGELKLVEAKAPLNITLSDSSASSTLPATGLITTILQTIRNCLKYLSTAITTEVTDRTNADQTLQTAINTEITNRTNADSTLQTAINTKAPLASPALTGTPTCPTATIP